MLSSLALKSGSLGKTVIARCLPRLTSIRHQTTGVSVPSDGTKPPMDPNVRMQLIKKEMEEMMDTWAKANELYYGKERDTKNFPIITGKDRETPPAVLLLIPKYYFDAFYSRTGVSGPYLLVGGIATTLLSKEIFTMEDHFFLYCAVAAASYQIAKRVGSKVAAFYNRARELNEENNFHKPLRQTRAFVNNEIQKYENAKEAIDATHDFIQAEKENVQLQLEAVYRERMDKVHQDVKRRLDYKMEIDNAKRRFEQEQMVNWITNNVVKSITPQQEKQSIADCIATLKKLSQTATA